MKRATCIIKDAEKGTETFPSPEKEKVRERNEGGVLFPYLYNGGMKKEVPDRDVNGGLCREWLEFEKTKRVLFNGIFGIGKLIVSLSLEISLLYLGDRLRPALQIPLPPTLFVSISHFLILLI